jgi:hypothetical protein
MSSDPFIKNRVILSWTGQETCLVFNYPEKEAMMELQLTGRTEGDYRTSGRNA